MSITKHNNIYNNIYNNNNNNNVCEYTTTQKMKFLIKDFLKHM